MVVEQKKDELQELVSQNDNQSLAGFFAYFIEKQPDPFADVDLNKFKSRLKDFLYLIALNTFSEKKGNKKFEHPDEELELLADKLNELKDFNKVEKFTDHTKESVIHEMAFRNHFDNWVLSYVEQDLGKLRKVFTPFQDKIILDIDFLIEFCKEIEFLSIIQFKYVMGFSHTKEFADFIDRFQSK